MYTKKNMETNNRSNYLRKTSTSNTLLKENEKPSQIVATNIIYNNSQKYMSNFNSNSIPREETPANISRLSAKQDNILINENKQLKDEIYELKKKNLEKDRLLKEKDLLIQELQNKINQLEKDISKSKDRSNNRNQRVFRRNTEINNKTSKEDEELALAIEKINEMERRNKSNSDVLKNNSRINNNFGFVIDSHDIINLDNFSDNAYFDEFLHRFNPNTQLENHFNHNFHINSAPLDEYERQIIDQLCPNPDNMTYEQLLELGEQVGHVDKGFTSSEVEKIPTIKYSRAIYKNLDKCSVCQYDFIQNEFLRKLTCGHLYHKSCIDEWLLKDKKCPMCKMEVSISKK